MRSVTAGTATLTEAVDAAIEDWVENVSDTFYLIGSAVGPHPYPTMVREFQSVIGKEAREQILAQENRLPDAVVACVGGGSNAIGIFHAFINDPVRLIGAEAAGLGVDTDKNAATLTKGSPGILHGALSYLLQDSNGQVMPPYSISAGLVIRESGRNSFLKDSGRAGPWPSPMKKPSMPWSCYPHEGIIPGKRPCYRHARQLALSWASADHRQRLRPRDKDVQQVKPICEQASISGHRAKREISSQQAQLWRCRTRKWARHRFCLLPALQLCCNIGELFLDSKS